MRDPLLHFILASATFELKDGKIMMILIWKAASERSAVTKEENGDLETEPFLWPPVIPTRSNKMIVDMRVILLTQISF